MTETIKRSLLISLGSLFFLLGLVGVILPVLPTTPFMILAAACFAKSSPRFHRLLLHNRWIGADLRRWESSRTMTRSTKKRASAVMIITFSISIIMLWEKTLLQILLGITGLLLLIFMWKIAEYEPH